MRKSGGADFLRMPFIISRELNQSSNYLNRIRADFLPIIPRFKCFIAYEPRSNVNYCSKSLLMVPVLKPT